MSLNSDLFLIWGCFLNIQSPGDSYVLRENNEIIQGFLKQEKWGSFLTIRIQRESKDTIPLHLSSFIWKMEMLMHTWLTRHQSDSLPDCLLSCGSWKAGNPVPQTPLQLGCRPVACCPPIHCVRVGLRCRNE